MTSKQHKFFYLPAWSACARANGWNTQAGIWGPEREGQPKFHDELVAKVRAVVKQISMAQHRGPKPEDFRHACTVVAIGQRKSSLDLTNDEVERVVCLFTVLTNPEDIQAVAEWTNPEIAKKQNLIAAAKKKAPQRYIEVVMKGKFHTTVLEDLSIKQLQALCFTLNQRKAAWNKPARQPEPETAAGPF